MTDPEPDRRARRVRSVVATSGVLGATAFLLFARPEYWRLGTLGAVISTLAWLLPFSVYYFTSRSLPGAWTVGVGLLVATGLTLWNAYLSASSTVGLSLIMNPLAYALAVLLVTRLERAFSDRGEIVPGDRVEYVGPPLRLQIPEAPELDLLPGERGTVIAADPGMGFVVSWDTAASMEVPRDEVRKLEGAI